MTIRSLFTLSVLVLLMCVQLNRCFCFPLHPSLQPQIYLSASSEMEEQPTAPEDIKKEKPRDPDSVLFNTEAHIAFFLFMVLFLAGYFLVRRQPSSKQTKKKRKKKL